MRLGRPDFLNPDFALSNLESGIKNGGFALVAELKTIPKEMKDTVPPGYILKQYRIDEFSPQWGDELFIGDPNMDPSQKESIVLTKFEEIERELGRRPTTEEVSQCFDAATRQQFEGIEDPNLISQTLEKFSLMKKAQKLQNRYRRLKEFFAQQLPEAFVPTHYIVGAEPKQGHPGQDGQRHVYELQPKIEFLDFAPVTSQRQSINMMDELEIKTDIPLHATTIATVTGWAQKIKEQFPNTVVQLKQELAVFIDGAKKIPDELKEIPYDIVHPANLKFTDKGLRILDVNYAVPNLADEESRSYFQIEKTLNRYNRWLQIWQIVHNNL